MDKDVFWGTITGCVGGIIFQSFYIYVAVSVIWSVLKSTNGFDVGTWNGYLIAFFWIYIVCLAINSIVQVAKTIPEDS